MSGTKTRRVVFSFDERANKRLSKLANIPIGQHAHCNHNRMIHHTCFPKPEPTGTKEITVTNQETGESRILLVPTFEPKD